MLAKTVIVFILFSTLLYTIVFSAFSLIYSHRIAEQIKQDCQMQATGTACQAEGELTLVYIRLGRSVQGYFRKGSYSFQFSAQGDSLTYKPVHFLPNANNWLLYSRRNLLPMDSSTK